MIHDLPLQNQIILACRQLRKQHEEIYRTLHWMCMTLDEEWAMGGERTVEELFEYLDRYDLGNVFLEPERRREVSLETEDHLQGWSQNVASQLHTLAKSSSELSLSLSRAAASLMIAASAKQLRDS